MSTFTSSAAAPSAVPTQRSIDDLDVAICRLARHLNAESYQLLMLVRDFDERFGWAKWSFPNCAEWLAWRCSVSVSAAREKIRTAHALRGLPAISAAFADGRLFVYKGACAHARGATQRRGPATRLRASGHGSSGGGALPTDSQFVARIRREVRIGSGSGARSRYGAGRRKASRRSKWSCRSRRPNWSRKRSTARSMQGMSRAERSSTATPGERSRSMHSSRLLGRISPAVQLSRLCAADHCQVVVHVDASALHGGAGRADLPVETIKRLTSDGSLVTVVEDDRGTPLDVGRKQRTVSTPLKRAVWVAGPRLHFPGRHQRTSSTRTTSAHRANGGPHEP